MSTAVLMTVDAVGGIWRYAIDLGGALADRGCRIVFAGLGPRPSGAQVAEAAAAGMLVWGDLPLDWRARRPGDLAGVGRWLALLVRMHRPDLVQVNLPTQAADLAIGKPIVAVCHSCLGTWFRAVEGRPAPAGFAWHEALARRGLARAAAVVAPSRAHARETAEVYGLADVAAVANTSRVETGAPGGGRGAIACGRWWDRGKNGAVLVAAARLSRVPVTLVGATEAYDGQRLHPAPARALGPVPHAAAIAAMREAAIFVSPSLYEPFGLAALEAARLGRPLVLSDIPTYRELWEGAAAFFDPRDPVALAALLDRLADDPEERARRGAAAQARALRFAPERQADDMLALYRRLTVRQAAE